MSTVACAVGFLRTAFAMFPIVKYTGQALLSPRNWDSWVLSDDRIRGATVDPIGNLFFDKISVSSCSELQTAVY
jgi:hypothetical protein